MLTLDDLRNPRPLRSGWLRAHTNFRPPDDEIPGDVAAHWKLGSWFTKSRAWRDWWSGSGRAWLEIRPGGSDDVSSIVGIPRRRGYLVFAHLTSLDPPSIPLVLGFRQSNFVSQTELNDFETAASNAYQRIFEHIQNILGLERPPFDDWPPMQGTVR